MRKVLVLFIAAFIVQTFLSSIETVRNKEISLLRKTSKEALTIPSIMSIILAIARCSQCSLQLCADL